MFLSYIRRKNNANSLKLLIFHQFGTTGLEKYAVCQFFSLIDVKNEQLSRSYVQYKYLAAYMFHILINDNNSTLLIIL